MYPLNVYSPSTLLLPHPPTHPPHPSALTRVIHLEVAQHITVVQAVLKVPSLIIFLPVTNKTFFHTTQTAGWYTQEAIEAHSLFDYLQG